MEGFLNQTKEFVTWIQQNEREFFDAIMKLYCVFPLIFLSSTLFVTAPYAPSISPMHISTVFSGIFFNIINGYTNSRWISVFGRDNYLYNENHQEIYKSPRFIFGVIIFLVGMMINVHHDNILFSLRRNPDNSISKSESIKASTSTNHSSKYKIPNGGLFNYITSPNYFGEIIEWAGFAIAAWFSLPAVIFLIATFSNLVPRSL
ncbi:2172_t:CDS:2, partial [Scutellospora calospora]